MSDHIESLYWWKDKINQLEHLDIIQFIEDHKQYYEYCQQILYKSEDPYHMTYSTLAEFIFYNYIISNVEIAKMVYNHYSLKLQYNYLQQSLWTICHNAYFSAIQWLLTENLLQRHLHYCFIDVCCNGHLEIAEYLYDHVKDDDYTLIKAYDLSIKKNHTLISNWLEMKIKSSLLHNN